MSEPPCPAISPWVRRFAPLLARGAAVLDLAAGSGRHTRWLLERGHRVLAVDRDIHPLSDLSHPALETIEADLEGPQWPLSSRRFDAVIVTNYLWRPRFPALVECVREDGLLLYETFADGNQAWGRPRRADFLLQPGELIQRVSPELDIVAYEHGYLEAPSPRVVQRICAVGRKRRLGDCTLPAGV